MILLEAISVHVSNWPEQKHFAYCMFCIRILSLPSLMDGWRYVSGWACWQMRTDTKKFDMFKK